MDASKRQPTGTISLRYIMKDSHAKTIMAKGKQIGAV